MTRLELLYRPIRSGVTRHDARSARQFAVGHLSSLTATLIFKSLSARAEVLNPVWERRSGTILLSRNHIIQEHSGPDRHF